MLEDGGEVLFHVKTLCSQLERCMEDDSSAQEKKWAYRKRAKHY